MDATVVLCDRVAGLCSQIEHLSALTLEVDELRRSLEDDAREAGYFEFAVALRVLAEWAELHDRRSVARRPQGSARRRRGRGRRAPDGRRPLFPTCARCSRES